MVSPIRSPPPEPAGEGQSSPPPPPQHPAVDPSPCSPENIAPTPPTPAPTPTPPPPPPQNRSFDSSNPLPSQTSTPAPSPPSTDPSPPLPCENQSPAQRPPSPSAPAPASSPPSPSAAASSVANSPAEADEGAVASGNTTLAHALTQPEEAMPPKAAAAMAESPVGSPQKESALTIAKLLSGEDPAATEAKPAADKVAPVVVTESVATAAAAGSGGGGGVGSKRWLIGAVPEKVRRAELRRAELGFRVSAAVFCLVSLSVMAADTTPGWSGDSFRRYNEYRYTLATSVMAFTYSGFQLVAEVHHLVTRRGIIRDPWGKYFNLAMDQVLAYLLLSSSSAALSRNDVWVSRFGVDQFAILINASASMAFLAFIALGLSSIISAYYVFSSVS